MSQTCPKRVPEFETADLNLASFVRCRGFNIVEIRPVNGRVTFVYEDSAELRQSVLDFANDALVAVRTFCSTLRDLKAITRDAVTQSGKDPRGHF